MNKTYLCVLPLSLFLAASSGQSATAEPECTMDPRPMPECVGEPQARTVNLNIHAMKAEPRCVRVQLGTTLVFRLTPKKNLERNTVRIAPKDALDSWLQGTNDLFQDLIIIEVPGEYDPDEEKTNKPRITIHDYRIMTPEKCLDPRVEVEH